MGHLLILTTSVSYVDELCFTQVVFLNFSALLVCLRLILLFAFMNETFASGTPTLYADAALELPFRNPTSHSMASLKHLIGQYVIFPF